MRTRKVTVLTIAVIMTAGCAQQHQNRFNFGKPDWKSGQQQYRKDVPDPTLPQILPKTHLAAARLHEQQGLIDEAVRQYRKAIVLSHQYVDAYHGLGVLLVRIGRVAEAVDVLAKAVQLAPNNALLRNNLGYALMRQQEWEPATVQFTQATQLQPFFARAHINLGMTLGKLGRFDEALESFRAVLPLADAYYNQGLMLRAQQRYVESIATLEKVLEINPNFTAAAHQLEQLAPYVQLAAAAKLAPETTSQEQFDEKETTKNANGPHRLADGGASPRPADQTPRLEEPTTQTVDAVALTAEVIAEQETPIRTPSTEPATIMEPTTMTASAPLPDGNVASMAALMEELDLSCPGEYDAWEDEDKVISSEADWVVPACVTYGDNLVAAIVPTTAVTGVQVVGQRAPSARHPAPDARPQDETPVEIVEGPVVAAVSADPEEQQPLATPIDWNEAFASLGRHVASDQFEQACDENEWPNAVLAWDNEPTIVTITWSRSTEHADELELSSQADRVCLADEIPADGQRHVKPQPRDFVAEMQRQTIELRELREDIACLETAVAAQTGFVDLDVSFADAGAQTWNELAPEMITIIPVSRSQPPLRSTALTSSIGAERQALYQAVLVQDKVTVEYGEQLLSLADRIALAGAATDQYYTAPYGFEDGETDDMGSILASAADVADTPSTLSMSVVQPITYSTDDAPILGLEQSVGGSGVYKIHSSGLGTAAWISDQATERARQDATVEELLDILSIASNDTNCWDARVLQEAVAPLINWSDGNTVTSKPVSTQSSSISVPEPKALDSTNTGSSGRSTRGSASSPGDTWRRYRLGRRAPSRPIPPVRE